MNPDQILAFWVLFFGAHVLLGFWVGTHAHEKDGTPAIRIKLPAVWLLLVIGVGAIGIHLFETDYFSWMTLIVASMSFGIILGIWYSNTSQVIAKRRSVAQKEQEEEYAKNAQIEKLRQEEEQLAKRRKEEEERVRKEDEQFLRDKARLDALRGVSSPNPGEMSEAAKKYASEVRQNLR